MRAGTTGRSVLVLFTSARGIAEAYAEEGALVMLNRTIQGDAATVLATLPDRYVHCCVTSPPYWGLRDYGVAGQIGLERSLGEYMERMLGVLAEVRRVLRDDGTLWLNLGDAYARPEGKGVGGASSKQDSNTATRADMRTGRALAASPKNLLGLPWRVAFALQDAGWILRSDIIWTKPNPMPESVRDRPTRAHEYVFLLSKGERYYYDADAVRQPYNEGSLSRYDSPMQGTSAQIHQPGGADRRVDAKREPNPLGANIRDVWAITTHSYSGAHFATFPEALVQRCMLAGCPDGGTVLDPFHGSGTVGLVARKMDRNYIGIELNPAYVTIANDRIANDRIAGTMPLFVPIVDRADVPASTGAVIMRRNG